MVNATFSFSKNPHGPENFQGDGEISRSSIVHIAAIGDLHCPYTHPEYLKSVFLEISAQADVVLLCGDLTHYGDPSEVTLLMECMQSLRCPIIGVLGNHDFEMGKADSVSQMLQEGGMTVLDGNTHSVCGIDFIGTKGFVGGFGEYALQSWGESQLKDLMRESRKEAEKLESSLRNSKSPHRVVLLHYSPIRQTVEGEAEEIIPFLGSSTLEDVLIRHPVDVVFHGHAHHGQLQGRTRNNIPVYNVALPLLRKAYSSRAPFFTYKMTLSDPIGS